MKPRFKKLVPTNIWHFCSNVTETNNNYQKSCILIYLLSTNQLIDADFFTMQVKCIILVTEMKDHIIQKGLIVFGFKAFLWNELLIRDDLLTEESSETRRRENLQRLETKE